MPKDYSYVARAGEGVGQIGAAVAGHYEDKAKKKAFDKELTDVTDMFAADFAATGIYGDLDPDGKPSDAALTAARREAKRFYYRMANEDVATATKRISEVATPAAWKFYEEAKTKHAQNTNFNNAVKDIGQGYAPGERAKGGNTSGTWAERSKQSPLALGINAAGGLARENTGSAQEAQPPSVQFRQGMLKFPEGEGVQKLQQDAAAQEFVSWHERMMPSMHERYGLDPNKGIPLDTPGVEYDSRPENGRTLNTADNYQRLAMENVGKVSDAQQSALSKYADNKAVLEKEELARKRVLEDREDTQNYETFKYDRKRKDDKEDEAQTREQTQNDMKLLGKALGSGKSRLDRAKKAVDEGVDISKYMAVFNLTSAEEEAAALYLKYSQADKNRKGAGRGRDTSMTEDQAYRALERAENAFNRTELFLGDIEGILKTGYGKVSAVDAFGIRRGEEIDVEKAESLLSRVRAVLKKQSESRARADAKLATFQDSDYEPYQHDDDIFNMNYPEKLERSKKNGDNPSVSKAEIKSLRKQFPKAFYTSNNKKMAVGSQGEKEKAIEYKKTHEFIDNKWVKKVSSAGTGRDAALAFVRDRYGASNPTPEQLEAVTAYLNGNGVV
jgi:hypothetical protein